MEMEFKIDWLFVIVLLSGGGGDFSVDHLVSFSNRIALRCWFENGRTLIKRISNRSFGTLISTPSLTLSLCLISLYFHRNRNIVHESRQWTDNRCDLSAQLFVGRSIALQMKLEWISLSNFLSCAFFPLVLLLLMCAELLPFQLNAL